MGQIPIYKFLKHLVVVIPHLMLNKTHLIRGSSKIIFLVFMVEKNLFFGNLPLWNIIQFC